MKIQTFRKRDKITVKDNDVHMSVLDIEIPLKITYHTVGDAK